MKLKYAEKVQNNFVVLNNNVFFTRFYCNRTVCVISHYFQY